MRIAFYSCKKYDKESFVQVNEKLGDKLHITFLKAKLDASTVSLAKDHQAVCLFVNDDAGAEVLEGLSKIGVKYVSLRCAGKNNVDQEKADALGLEVISVPSYSPDAVAEFAVGMILSLVRKYHKAYNRVREGDFRLSGLEGFNLKGKTVGLIGTGQIGLLTGKILSLGFGCKVIASDPYPNEKKALEFEITYVQTIEELLKASDIISLHCPLLESTHHILNETTLPLTKKGVILVNTSRGGLIDTKALIRYDFLSLTHREFGLIFPYSCLKTGHLGAVGLDVYEGESAYFFGDYSAKIIQDDDLSRLMTFYNVLISGHQAFLTSEALLNIAEYTVEKLLQLEKDKK
ncbi:MAG: hypothetical protein M1829_004141 [Trizodia sp. TS-e1964]|nr:MAG: hypothetical protein M1829_004141 [Trizodia sp. TS-e1964]